MKKITLDDFERSHVKKTNRWLSWLSFCLMLLFGSYTFMYGQGNTCIDPLTITSLPYSLTGDTANYGDDYDTVNIPPVATGAIAIGTSYTYYLNGDDVVFKITPSINGTLTVNTSFTATYGGIFVFTGCPFASTVGYNVSSSAGVKEITNLPVLANTTYYIAISTWASPQSSAFTLNITGSAGLLTPPEACTGTPSAGTASLTPNMGNAGATFVAKAVGVTNASGLTYQWQKNSAGTWQDIAGATTIYSSIVAETGIVGSTTDYRLKVTCTATAQVAYSTIVTYTISLVYCTPAPGGNSSDEMINFTLNNLNNTSAPSAGVLGYKDYSGIVAPAQLELGVPYIATVTGGTGSGNHGAAIWIDYNKNGTFEASEKVAFIGNTIGANATASFPEFIVPAGTPLGLYRLRVQHQYNKSGELLDPCVLSSTLSETEDYSVQVFPAPTCLQPSGLAALNITSSSADLSWTSTGTSFDVEWGPQGFLPGAGTTVTGVTAPYLLTGLSSNTNYSFYVRNNCGATNGYSLWTGPYKFKSTCGSVTSFFENFDSYTATGSLNPLPTCWVRAGNASTYITTGSLAPMSPANRLYISANGTATTPTEGIAIMPAVSNLQAETHRLKFKAYASTTGKTMEIGYFTQITDLSTFVVIETIVLPGTALASTQEFSVEPNAIPAGVTNLAFRNNAPTGSTTVYIDDVTWESLPLCADITLVQTQTFNSTSATISWEPGSSESAWEYVYGPASTTTSPAGLTPIAVTNNPLAELTGLASNTTFKIWIRSNCGSGALGNWPQNPYTFTTSCAPVTAFSENFDSYTLTGSTNPIGNCWTRFGNTAFTYITTGSTAPMSPSNRLYLSASATGTSLNAVAVMPPVSNLQAGTHRLKFKAYATTAGKSLELGFYEVDGDPESFTVLEAFELPSTVVANTVEFNYIPEFVPVGVESLAFRNNGPAFTGTTTMYIDDVIWEPIPACPDVTEIEFSNITATSLDVLWNPGGSETAWQYAYGAITVTDPSTLTPISVLNNPYASISDLTPNTKYNFWIRSSCGSGVFGTWSDVRTFTTACAPLTTFYENFDTSLTGSTNPMPNCWQRAGNGSTYVTTGSIAPNSAPNRLYMFANGTATTPTESIAIMPAVSNLAAGTHRLKFRAYGSTSDKSIEIGFYGDASDLTTYVPLTTISLMTTTSATAAVYTYAPTGIPAGITTLAFRNAGMPTSYSVYIDDVVWEVQPLCPDVNSVQFVGATSSTASIAWNPGGSETAWEYVYGLATVTDPSTLTPFPVVGNPQTIISGLLPSTTYKVWVRSTCGANLGAFSAPTTFATACEAITTLPWNEGFEGITTVGSTAFPPCWSKENGDWASSLVSTYNTPRTGTKYIRNSWSAVNEYMWTPGFELTANTSYDFSFYMQGDGHTGWNVDVFQNAVQNSAGAIQLGSTTTANGVGSTLMQQYQLVNRTFVPTTSGVYYFAVRVNQASGSPWYIAFDDFNLKLSPNCVPPTVAAATAISTSDATFNWTAPLNAPANGYEYYYTTTLSDFPNATTTPSGSVAAGITTLSLIGLNNSTTYKFFVRSVCGATESSEWSQGVTFATLCDAATLPYVIDFESVAIPNLPICTTTQNAGTGNEWLTVNNPGSGFLNKTLKYSWNGSNAANVWFYTNVMNLVAGTPYTVAYKYGAGSTAYVESLKVAIGSTANATTMTTVLADHPSITSNVPQNNNVTFTVPTSGLYVIGFQAYSIANQLSLFLDDIIIQQELGSSDFNNNSFTAYPNPVKDHLTIRYNENINNVTVFNLLGQQLFTKDINATEGKVDMSHLASGTYLVKVTSGENIQTIKVIKE